MRDVFHRPSKAHCIAASHTEREERLYRQKDDKVEESRKVDLALHNAGMDAVLRVGEDQVERGIPQFTYGGAEIRRHHRGFLLQSAGGDILGLCQSGTEGIRIVGEEICQDDWVQENAGTAQGYGRPAMGLLQFRGI